MASIRKIEGKKGVTFKITVTAGTDPTGKQIRHFKTWKPEAGMTARQAQKEAERVAFEFEKEIALGFQTDTRQTFEQYAAYVYTLREMRGDKPQTLARIRRQTAHINEFIGRMRITDIRPQHINAMYKRLSEPGANRWGVFAAPAVDFKELVGSGTYNDLAEKAGVYGRLICRLCNNQYISLKNAAIIEEHLGRKDLFRIVGNDKPLSPGAIRDYHGIVYTVLAQAEKEMLIVYNPAERVTLPPRKRVRPSRTLQPEQIRDILTALESEPLDFQALVHLFIVTGCRRGELLALTWDKIDFKKRQIFICQSMNYLPEMGVYSGPTKTESSRYVAIPAQTVELLKKYRKWQAERLLTISGFVFTRKDGRPLNPATVNSELDKFSERHGLPHLNPHLFRHSAASILLSSGVDVLTVSKMLGHVDASTTLDTYAHEIERARQKTAECVSSVLLETKNA